MECPTCRAPYQPGDRFCGSCGERLGDGAAAPVQQPPPWSARGAPAAPGFDPGAATLAVPPGFPGGPPPAAPAPPPFGGAPPMAPAGAPAAAGRMTCPTCSAPVEPGDATCLVCGTQLTPAGAGAGGGPVAPAATARTPVPMPVPVRGEARSSGAVCPIHGEMDPTWTRCPQCIREGRDGRLVPAGRVTPTPEPPRPSPVAAEPLPPMPAPSAPLAQAAGMTQAAPPVAQAAPVAPPAPPVPPPAIRETIPPPDSPPAASAPVARPEPPPAAPAVDRPVSSVGGTVVIRRRPRSLAFLIEKEGEQVGRVVQLEQDITDIGRDPRNHVVVSDVLVSGFHARMERSPDGGYVIADRGSTNGSRLNGEPLTAPRPMAENDELGIGNTTLVLKVVT